MSLWQPFSFQTSQKYRKLIDSCYLPFMIDARVNQNESFAKAASCSTTRYSGHGGEL